MKLQPYTALILKHHSRDSYSEEVHPCNFSYSLHFIPGAESGCIASADAVLTGATKNAVISFCLFQFICDLLMVIFNDSQPPDILKM